MGRIKTTLIKRTAEDLISQHIDKFTENFDKNKKILEEVAEIPSKKLRNTIAGQITRHIKRQRLEA